MLSDTLTLVRAINRYDAMTIKQVGRYFHLADGSYTAYSQRLAKLAAEKVLSRKWIPHPTMLRGGPLVVYILGPKGRELLRSHGDAVKRFDFGHGEEISKHNWHSLWVTDVLISAQLWVEATPGVWLATQLSDFDFKRDRRFPSVVTWGDGTRHGVAMDSLLAFVFEDTEKDDKQYLIELETGTHAPAAVREKVKNLVLFVQDFAKVFGTDLFSGYLFLAMGIKDLSPDDHRKMILNAIAQQLREMDVEHYAPLFRVTACPPDRTKLFTEPVWWMPGDYDPYPLLD